MTKEFDYLIYIGRFQPFTLAHEAVVKTALQKANNVIVLIGSANLSVSLRNPFSYNDRAHLILKSFPGNYNVLIRPLNDYAYNDLKWVAEIQKTVTDIVHPDSRVGLIGYSKDSTSYYLNLFPQWGEHVDVPAYVAEDGKTLDATTVRNLYFSPYAMNSEVVFKSDKLVPQATRNFLEKFSKTEQYKALCKEHTFIEKYRKSWEIGQPIPYPVIFVTTDAVVYQAGHVLLVTRKAAPGEGMLAMPGGFLNPDETLEDGMLRELNEETNLKVPKPVLKGNIKLVRTFDDPKRSMRGRTITTAFLIVLPPNGKLPKIKAGDDAANAKWYPWADLKPSMLYEDHYFIMDNMINSIKTNA